MKQVLLLIYFFGLSVFAQNGVFDPLKSKGQLFEYAHLYNTGSNQLSIAQITSNGFFEQSALESENHSVGFTTDNFWVKFKIRNSTATKSTYYLETARPVTDIANLYQIARGDTLRFASGDQLPFSERQVQHRATVFKLELPPESVQDIYLNFSSDGETLNIPLNLYTESEFWLMNYKQQLFLGLFYGLLFLGGIIYLFFYTSLKEKSFLYYGLYVFSIGFMQLALDGLIYQYLLPQGGYLNSRAVLFTALLSNFFLLKYCEHFLKIDQLPKIFSFSYKAIYVILGVLLVSLFINAWTLQVAYPISNINGLFSLLLILVSLFTMRYKKISVDPYFSIGIFFLVIGLLGFVMNNLSLLPNNFFTLNSAKFGSGFEVIFLSLSMTNLIRKLRLEKEKSQEIALKKSEEISQLKTYFMSNMSHELRTPINAIMGIAQHELEVIKDKKTRKQFEIIKNASLSLLSNVNDIIDFERIEKNELRLNHQEFNPSIVLNQISNNWSLETQKKGLSFKFEMDSEIPSKVNGDSERFVQIINNVLSNAVKFTHEGGIEFKLNCTSQPNGTSRFSFKITDTGVGIADTEIESIFDSFGQMKHDHKREFGGVGLGLTIVKHLVNLFEGTIKIESKPKQGTTIFIDIPLKVVEKVSVEKIVSNETINLNKLHVLVVEDNKINQMVMRKILGSMPNISFAVVDNGKEALDALKKDVYDLVLMDLQMPIMDGYEATKIIRSGELGKSIEGIPIIAVTADAMQETRDYVLQIGMNDYLTKPVNKELLFNKMDGCIDKNLNMKIA